MRKSRHFLIERAYIYPRNTSPKKIEEAEYDPIAGYWIMKNSQKPAVEDPTFSGPKTKKADLETGEDQKSE
jgi:hypothetical protein